MRQCVVYLVYNISGYLVAELDALVKQADVIVFERPCKLTSSARQKFGRRIRWIDRTRLRSCDDALRELGDVRPSICICGGWFDKIYLSLTRELHKRGSSTVLSIDTPWEGKVKQIVNCMLSRVRLVPYFDFGWGAGSAQVRYLRHLGFSSNRIRRGTYSADVEKFSGIYEHNRSREAWPHVFLYVGRYVAVKNMDRMQEAFVKACEKRPQSDWKLICIGGGALWESRFVHPRIAHLGYKNPFELQKYVGEAGCFVLPSLYEPWGVVVHEFAAMGLPLICSKKVMATEAYLRPNETGYLFDPFSVSDMTRAFISIMDLSDENLKAMGEGSHRLGLSYTPEHWARQVLEFGVTHEVK